MHYATDFRGQNISKIDFNASLTINQRGIWIQNLENESHFLPCPLSISLCMLLWSFSMSLFNIVMYVTIIIPNANVQCCYVWYYDNPQCLCSMLLCMILQSFPMSMFNGIMYVTMIIPDAYVQCCHVCYYDYPGCLCCYVLYYVLSWELSVTKVSLTKKYIYIYRLIYRTLSYKTAPQKLKSIHFRLSQQ